MSEGAPESCHDCTPAVASTMALSGVATDARPEPEDTELQRIELVRSASSEQFDSEDGEKSDEEEDHSVHPCPGHVQVFSAEWDDEGVYFYQAYNDDIANWAVEHQKFGGPKFKPARMTWIKPSFAWVLYRSGYGHKHNQNRILKVKLPHHAVADLLSGCKCRHGGGGSKGRVQWDPARDLMTADGKVPRKMLRDRAIQVGLAGSLSELYVRSVISITDVTGLAHKVGRAHQTKSKQAMIDLGPELPMERPYMPHCPTPVLMRLMMVPGQLETRAPRRRRGR